MSEVPVIAGAKEATREDFRSYWVEEHGAPTIENMMLDTNAVAMDVLERPEILAELPSLNSKVVLELGAGIGRFSSALAEKAARVVAVDFVDASCKINRESNSRFSNLEVVCEDALKLQFEPNSFDIVFSNWLLMYLSDAEVQTLANNCISWLKPGGRIFFRESCFHRSGNAPRTWNPTVYRDPRSYFSFFNSARSSDGCRFQLCKTSCVHAYVRIKNNPNQVWWIWEKCSSGHLIRYLDTQQYDYNSVFRYEKMYGPGFMSTGGKALLDQITQPDLLCVKTGDRVLDVGCGFGGNMLHFAERGCYVHGIDISGMMVSIASERYLKLSPAIQQAVSISVGDIFSVEFIPNSFDVICVRDFLMHFSESDKQILFTKFHRWLAPGGSVIVTDYVCSKNPSEWSDEFQKYVAQRKYSLVQVSDYLRIMANFSAHQVTSPLSEPGQFVDYLRAQIASYKNLVVECQARISKFQNAVKEAEIFDSVYQAVVATVDSNTLVRQVSGDEPSDELAGLVAQSAAEIAKRYIDSKTRVLEEEETNLEWVEKFWNLKIDACKHGELGFFILLQLPSLPGRVTVGAAGEVPTSVYVGHICPNVGDTSVQELLGVCGKILNWNRQTLGGKFANFGFCEFANLQAAARAVTFLNDRQLGSKPLVVKADAKVVAEGVLQAPDATIGALLTTINAQWRKEAMIADSLRTEPTLVTSAVRMDSAPVNVKRRKREETTNCLPHWFKDSRRESGRLRRLERKSSERMAEFEKLVSNWEQREWPKLLENDKLETSNSDQVVLNLVDQDGIDGYKVRSNFSASDRRREIEFDLQDALLEEEERKEELKKVQETLQNFQVKPPIATKTNNEIDDLVAKSVPKNVAEIDKFRFDFERIFKNKTACQQLANWLTNKTHPLVAKYLLAVTEKENSTINELIFRLNQMASNVNETNIDLICTKLFQMLAFIQITSSN